MAYKRSILFVFILTCCYSQNCINPAGKAVDWLLVLNAPASLSHGYLYFDSQTSSQSLLKFEAKSDQEGQPISNTLSQINNLPGLGYIAWNDQNPNGSTTSVKAHSKNLLIFNKTSNEGIVIVHSIPKYPSIVDGKVEVTIPDSQRVYGQHFFCFKATSQIMKEIINKTSVTRLNIYANNVPIAKAMTSENSFEYVNFKIGNFAFKSIHKNGYINSSIFEDGLSALFGSHIIAQTWGRPIQQPWCGTDENPYFVSNAKLLEWSTDYSWKQTQDHAKWAVTISDGVNYSCFGDLNRMSSQWKRGGSFYCLQSQSLRNSLKKMIVGQEDCLV